MPLDEPVVHTVRGIDKTTVVTVVTHQGILLMEDTLA
jgi:hypothetical protein